MNVYTYFNPVPEMPSDKEHALVVLWQKSWRRCGFEPVVLTHLHAEAHPRFTEYDALVRSLPSVNPKEYEVACWHRWLAAAVIGQGIFVDYDLIANGFSEEMLSECRDEVTVLDRGGVPCAVYLIGNGAYDVVDGIFTAPHQIHDVNGRPHISDMHHFQSRGWPKAPDLTAPVGAEGWREAPAIHFSHSDTARTFPGQDRLQVIRREMKL